MSVQSGERPAGSDATATATATATASGGYEGVGHSLRVVRERRGLQLADVSARLRIRRPYLEAIESGHFTELPGAVYINGFLRQYAEFLGLDAEQVLKTYQDEADAPQRTVLNFPMPRPEDRTPRFWLIGGALILAVAIYALWYRHQEALRLGHDLIEAVPARLADLVPSPTPIAPAPATDTPPASASAPAPATPAANAADASAPAASAPAASAPAGGSMVASLPNPAVQTAPATAAPATPAPSGPTTSVSPPPASPAAPAAEATPPAQTATPAPAAPATPSTAAPAPAAQPATPPAAGDAAASSPAADVPAAVPSTTTAAPETPAVFGAQDAPDARVRLEATAPAWIQVRGANNEQVFTRLLHAGERYVVPPGQTGLTLLTGNAGGLKIIVDGRTLPPLGATGEVKRGIPLDADLLKAAEGSQG